MSARSIVVTGGAGYVGSVLVPKLLAAGHHVKVLDLMLYGDTLPKHERLEIVQGDMRERAVVDRALAGCDTVIHLACISNDPSFELDPALGRSINYDAFLTLLDAARAARISRFIYASTSSVYGVKEEAEVTEDLPREPLTDYSKYKAMCEDVLEAATDLPFTWVTIRPATVCGYSPRMRLDLSVNILTTQAYHNGRVTVFGGAQQRPNVHIEDITDLYVQLLDLPDARIHRRTFNAGYENHSIAEIAEMVRRSVSSMTGREIEVVTTPTNDMRSYRISSEKIRRELGFVPKRSIEEAVRDLVRAFQEGKLPDALTDARYSNIRTMQKTRLR